MTHGALAELRSVVADEIRKRPSRATEDTLDILGDPAGRPELCGRVDDRLHRRERKRYTTTCYRGNELDESWIGVLFSLWFVAFSNALAILTRDQ